MRNRNRTTPPAASTGPSEVASRERARAAAYGAMGRNDVVEVQLRDTDHYPVAPNGRPYDPRSGRYVDR